MLPSGRRLEELRLVEGEELGAPGRVDVGLRSVDAGASEDDSEG